MEDSLGQRFALNQLHHDSTKPIALFYCIIVAMFG